MKNNSTKSVELDRRPRWIMATAFGINMGIAGIRLWQMLQSGGGAGVFGSQLVESTDGLLFEGERRANIWEEQATRETDSEKKALLLNRSQKWRKRMLRAVSVAAIGTMGFGAYELATNNESVEVSEIGWSLTGVAISGAIAGGLSRASAGGASSSRDVWRHAVTDTSVGLFQTAAMVVSYKYGADNTWALAAPNAAAIVSSGAVSYFNWPTNERISGKDHNVFPEEPIDHASPGKNDS